MLNVTKGDLCVGVHLKRCLYVSSPAEIVHYFYFMSWSPTPCLTILSCYGQSFGYLSCVWRRWVCEKELCSTKSVPRVGYSIRWSI